MRIYQIFLFYFDIVRSRQWINKDCVNFIAIKMHRNVVLGCKEENKFLSSIVYWLLLYISHLFADKEYAMWQRG